MMAAMHCHAILRMIGGAVLAVLAADAAKAQFYDLDGAYHCLTAPDESCKKADTSLPPAPPPELATATVEEVIGRIRTMKVTPADIEALEKRAAAKEARAVEALAWCRLNGLGAPEDPLEAYWLYGEAAQLGIPTAASNQSAIFETRLSQEQRQLVLMREQTK